MLDNILRYFPNFRGKHRLSRLLFKNVIKSSTDLKITGKYGCKYLLPNIKENVAFDIYINGIYEPETFEILNENIPQGGVLLDLGANIGAVTIPLCKKRPDIRVVCVEAAPWVYSYLKENIKANQLEKQVSIYNLALFDKDDETLMFTSPKERFGEGTLSLKQQGLDTIPVKSVRVDTLLEQIGISHVDFIKIDIEGFEYFAFLGAVKLLTSEDAPDVLFEFGDWAERNADLKLGSAQEKLIDYGYKLYLKDNGTTQPLNSIITEDHYMIYASKQLSNKSNG